MIVACWSCKGGVGTTVVSAALALLVAGAHPAGCLLVDLGGDAPTVLGSSATDSPDSPGVAGWLAAGADVPADALARIEVAAGRGLGLLPRGSGPLDPTRAGVLAALLDRAPRTVVVDCGRTDGTTDDAVAGALLDRAQRSLLVIRPCFVAVERARRAPRRPTGLVVVREPGRVLSPDDVASALDAPVVATVESDPAVARTVDAGLLSGRLPRALRPLGDVA